MRAVFLISILLLAGCSEDWDKRSVSLLERVCEDSTTEQRARFTLDCISNANPNSDEEPEDWIALCQELAEKAYCRKQTVILEQRWFDGAWQTVRKT